MRTRCSYGGTISYGFSLPSLLLLFIFSAPFVVDDYKSSDDPNNLTPLHSFSSLTPSFFTLFYLYSSSSPIPLCWQSPEPQLSFRVSNMQLSSGTQVWSLVNWAWSLSILLFRYTLTQTYFFRFRGHHVVSLCFRWARSKALFLSRFFFVTVYACVCSSAVGTDTMSHSSVSSVDSFPCRNRASLWQLLCCCRCCFVCEGKVWFSTKKTIDHHQIEYMRIVDVAKVRSSNQKNKSSWWKSSSGTALARMGLSSLSLLVFLSFPLCLSFILHPRLDRERWSSA